MRTVEEVLSKALGVPKERFKDTTTPEEIESWDSFNGLILVTELEKNFKVKFTIDEVVAVKKVGDIKKVLKKHGVKT